MIRGVTIADDFYPGPWSGSGLVKNMEQLLQIVFLPDGSLANMKVVVIGSLLEIIVKGNEGIIYWSDAKTKPRGYVTSFNAGGLKSAGWEEYKYTLGAMIQLLHDLGMKAVVNVAGFTPQQVASMARNAYEAGADLVIINLSCGNTGGEVLFFSHEFVHMTMALLCTTVPKGKQALLKVPYIPDRAFLRSRAKLFSSFEWAGGVIAINTIASALALGPDGLPYISPFGGLAGMGGAGIRDIALGQCLMWLQEFDELHADKVTGASGGIQRKEDWDMFTVEVGAHFGELHTAVREWGSVVFDDFFEEEAA